MADKRTFHYICSNGHEILAEKPVEKCLAIVKGSPCKGKLTRIGRGSKTKPDGDT